MAAHGAGLMRCGRGYADPVVISAARLIQERGWRVTSIFRFNDSSAHGRGLALDVAPMIACRCGFDAELARLILLFLKRRLHRNFRVISEVDHVHIELSDRSTYGTYLNQELVEHVLQA